MPAAVQRVAFGAEVIRDGQVIYFRRANARCFQGCVDSRQRRGLGHLLAVETLLRDRMHQLAVDYQRTTTLVSIGVYAKYLHNKGSPRPRGRLHKPLPTPGTPAI